MNAFFKGWRRKTGCVLLALALAFCAAWLRSFVSTNDVIQLDENHSLYSHDGSFSWNITSPDIFSLPILGLTPVAPDQEFGIDFVDDHLSRPAFTWRHEFCGFVASEISIHGTRIVQYWVPYWSVTTPLILASAWLLLRKPRIPSAAEKPLAPVN